MTSPPQSPFWAAHLNRALTDDLAGPVLVAAMTATSVAAGEAVAEVAPNP